MIKKILSSLVIFSFFTLAMQASATVDALDDYENRENQQQAPSQAQTDNNAKANAAADANNNQTNTADANNNTKQQTKKIRVSFQIVRMVRAKCRRHRRARFLLVERGSERVIHR